MSAYARSRSRNSTLSAASSCCALFRSRVQEHGQPEPQVGDQRARAVRRSPPCRPSEKFRCLRIFFSSISIRISLDDVADVLQIDRERHDVRPAPAFSLLERIAAHLRQVKLDRGVQIVDVVIHPVNFAGELEIVGAQNGQRACAAFARSCRPGASLRAPRMRWRAPACRAPTGSRCRGLAGSVGTRAPMATSFPR